MSNQVATDFLTSCKPRYASTPFAVDEYDASDEEFEKAFASPYDKYSRFTLGPLSDKSYLILDFEEGEFSPCDTEFGYGITHPQEQIGVFVESDASSESIWYDDPEDTNSDFDDSGSLFASQVPSLTQGSSISEEDTDGFSTPVLEEGGECIREIDEAVIEELRASLTRHLPPSSNGSDYFEALVADALSSLDQHLREDPVDCFEELCWDSQTRSPVSLDNINDVSFRSSPAEPRIFIPSWELMDVPEEVPMQFDWEWKNNPESYKYTISSPSYDIGFSPRTNLKKPQHTHTSFKRFARHFKLA